jgi:eukaryotic-like serine/threonine-protein kinase
VAPHHWQQLKEILGEALERDGDERTTFVMQRCGTDTTLRDEIESYLKNSGQTVEACAEKMRETLLCRFPSEWIGHQLGAYRIVQEIGRGGMGTVFLAARADGQFEKQVAIKLLKRGTDTDEVLRRFRSERQILAQLEHPSIARLIDAGTTDDGLPYFVMEYVSGKPITTYVREHGLTIHQRLELFLKVCAAVEQAHHDHIIHRDLKPGNILVNEEGEPKLLDFGIAKLLESGENPLEVTATNQQRFTPTCVSPEQTRGEPVTPASDIYALGALLYELLTDQTPHRFSTRRPSSEELARVVCEEEPVLPSAAVSDRNRQHELHGNLDNIALCALRKEPERRYRSVVAFAEDVKRYLNERPVQARPNTTIYRVQRFLARNRSAGLQFGLVLAIVLALVTILIFVSPRLRQLVRGSEPPRQTAAPIDKKSIAVLPFDRFNTEKESGYFVDGVQDNILTDLAKVSDLKVISRSGVEHYRGATKDAREIGRALNVANVLEGSVQKSGDRIRVNVRLVDTQTDTQIWSEGYERKVDDLFSLQSELAQSIVTQLKATLSPREKAAIEHKPTEDMEAYDLYLRARALMSKVNDAGGRNRRDAIQLLDAALARDPNFTLAHCLAVDAHIILYRYVEHTPAHLASAKDAADKALELAPYLGESHLAKARYYYHGLRDYLNAQRELDVAAPTLSGDAEFLTLSSITERRLGRWKDAIRDGEKAVALNPQDAIYVATLMETYRALRDYAKMDDVGDKAIARLPAEVTNGIWARKVDGAIGSGALDRAQSTIEAAPRNVDWKDSMFGMVALFRRQYAEAARFYDAKAPDKTTEILNGHMQGEVQRWLGDEEKSRRAFEHARDAALERLRERPNDPILAGELAIAYAGLHQRAEALSVASHAVETFPIAVDSIDGVNCLNSLAEVYVLLGDSNEALNALEKVADLPNSTSYGDLRFNPVWDILRKDPRFDKILARTLAPPRYE